MNENLRSAICPRLGALATYVLLGCVFALPALAEEDWTTIPDAWRFQRDKVLLEGDGASKRDSEAPRELFQRPMDVTLYHLQLEVTDQNKYLRGTVDITLEALENLPTLDFDFTTQRDAEDGMTVLATRVDGNDRPFIHTDNVVSITPAATVPAQNTVTVSIDYQGSPPEEGFFGFRLRYLVFGSDPPVREIPVLETLSEPDGARSWWPCHDTPVDAAQVRLTITGPEDMTLAAPGLRELDENLGGGLRRQQYWMPAPIPTYLVSINMANYVRWEETTTVHTYPDETEEPMMLEFFSAPREENKARVTWDITGEMLGVFEDWFGPYPFAANSFGSVSFPTLKYGMSMFTFFGGMEHPTISSMGQFTVSDENEGRGQEWVVAHELAHQWFGDCTRVSRWGDIWLNEGFARYCEILWREHTDGYTAAHERLTALRRRPDGEPERDYTATVVDPSSLFGTTVYNKGAWVLHMLRQVLGRDGLLTAMRNFIMDPALRFNAVTSADFQRHCEALWDDPNDADALPGDDMTWFFEPWLTQEGRPAVTVDWIQGGDMVDITVTQPADRVYRLPLPVRLVTEDAGTKRTRDVTVWLDPNRPSTQTQIAEPLQVTEVLVDADDNWLVTKQVNSVDFTVALFAPFPNPMGLNAALSVPLFVRNGGRATVEVYDLRGRLVRTVLDEVVGPGRTVATWNGADADGDVVASGTYFMRLVSSGEEQVQRVTLIR